MNDWFACLSHEQVVERWPRIRELLEPAMPRNDGEIEVDDILYRSEEGAVHIAIMGIGEEIVLAVVTEVITYPRKKVLNLTAIGGTHSALFAEKYLPVLISYARDMGCDCVQSAWDEPTAGLFLRVSKTPGYQWHKAYSTFRMGV